MPSYPIVGMHFRPPAKSILQVLHMGCPLHVVPEPENSYDTNALRIEVASADIKEEMHDTLNTLAAGQGFTTEDILAQEYWQLGYIEAKNGSAGMLAPKIAGRTVSGTLCFDLKGKPMIDLLIISLGDEL